MDTSRNVAYNKSLVSKVFSLKPFLSLARNRLTTILFHRFFFEGETAEHSRDRLKRQCEWLCQSFNPVTSSEALAGLNSEAQPGHPLMVTIDDAKIEVLSILDIFESFSIPVSIFACVGWCAQEENKPLGSKLALARLVAEIEWYRGPATTIQAGRERLLAGDGVQAAETIDHLLRRVSSGEVDLRELFSAPNSKKSERRICCTLKELGDAKSPRVAIGAHSMSHINLATASDIRLDFEISETRKILIESVGECDAFAYPYGMAGTFSPTTSRKIVEAGFCSAFLSHSDFAGPNTERFHLPRISMPDRPISHFEFCARVAGAGVVYRKMRSNFRRLS